MHFISILSLVTLSATLSVGITDESETSEPFKLNKLNLVWTKAQNSLGPDKLKDLKNDLLHQERDELSLKKIKAHNHDKEGLIEAAVRKKLLTIMTKYHLEKYFDDVHPHQPSAKENFTPREVAPESATFRDSKLEKLWKKAEKSGFTQEQLMILHEEFEHQQAKLDEHYEIMNAIDEEIREKQLSSNANSLESDLESSQKKQKATTKEKPSQKKARLESNSHQSLKDKHSQLKKGYETLHKKISTGAIDEARPFAVEKINALWAAALESDFSPSELESMKEELEHYQTRVEKLEHFQNQLERNQVGAEDTSDSYAEDGDETKHIKRRIKDLRRKVEKTHKSIEKMIKRGRDEL